MMAAAPTGELLFRTMREWLGRADELALAGELDLKGITRADSSGVAYLLELTRRANKAGRELTFANPGPDLWSLIEFLQVDEVLKIRR